MSRSEVDLRVFESAIMHEMVAPTRTLLLVIDVQVDFAAPGGAVDRLGLDLGACEGAIDKIELLVAAARRAGAPVGFARVVSKPETDSPVLRALHERLGGTSDAAAICRSGTPGANYHRLHPEPGDIQISKTRYSCFVGTMLDEELRARGIDTLVVTGVSTDCCVDSTVRDAFHRDFHVFVVADACADYDLRAHEAALSSLGRHCAVVVESTTVLAAWSALESAD